MIQKIIYFILSQVWKYYVIGCGQKFASMLSSLFADFNVSIHNSSCIFWFLESIFKIFNQYDLFCVMLPTQAMSSLVQNHGITWLRPNMTNYNQRNWRFHFSTGGLVVAAWSINHHQYIGVREWSGHLPCGRTTCRHWTLQGAALFHFTLNSLS